MTALTIDALATQDSEVADYSFTLTPHRQRVVAVVDGQVVVDTAHAIPYEVISQPEFLRSPFAGIFEGAGDIRRRLEGADLQIDFPILEELRDEGASDYVAMPMSFSDGLINAVTLATHRRGGFTTAQLGLIKRRDGEDIEAVIGDAANRAARIEAMSKELGHCVIVSASVCVDAPACDEEGRV